MKRFWPLIFVLLGILVIFGGFLYDVSFAGIPYQDPTPELTAQYAFHSQVASEIRWSGLGISLVGVLTMTVRRLLNGSKNKSSE